MARQNYLMITVAAFLLMPAKFVFSDAQPPVPKEFVLGLSLSTLENPFFIALKNGAIKEAAKHGVKLLTVDANNDPATELTRNQELIAKKIDALLINPTDSDKVTQVIYLANQKGVPVVTLDRKANKGKVISHVASDNVLGGRLAAKFLISKLGKSGRLVELKGIPTTSAAIDRGKGFNEVIDQHQTITVIAQKTAHFNRQEAFNVFSSILKNLPHIDGVFAHNDEMILGAIDAAKLKGRSKEMVFVGFDAVKEAVGAVKKGDLAGTIAQEPELIGAIGVAITVQYLKGNPIKPYIPVPLKVVAQ